MGGVADRDAGTTGIQYRDAGALADALSFCDLITALSPSCGENAGS